VLDYARDFPDVPLDHHSLRLGNLLPARLFLDLFGYGQVAYYAWPFLTSIALVLATFALGAVLFGRWTGAAAALMIIFHPVLVDTKIGAGSERMTSWHLLPDIPSAAFLTAGLAFLIGAARRRPPPEPGHEGDNYEGDGGPTWWFYAAGLCFGWAYLVRELSVFYFPVIVGVLIVWRLPLKRWIAVAGPMVGCLVFEMVMAAAVHGDALARLHVDAEHGSPPLSELTRADALMRFPRAVVQYPQTLVVLASLILTILGAALIRRRGHVLMLAWFLSLWLPMTLVSGLLDPGFIRINASLMRYWVPVLPQLCLGAAATVAAGLAFLGEHTPMNRRMTQLVTAAVAVVGLAAWCVPIVPRILANPRDASWNDARAYLSKHDDRVATVITDDRDALILGIYHFSPLGEKAQWHAVVRKLPHALRRPPQSDGAASTFLLWTPELSHRRPGPGDGWRLVLRERQLRIYAPLTR
jgi:4-amino-4-deoxy-L-arabinose transferase-like glycosyltransferase